MSSEQGIGMGQDTSRDMHEQPRSPNLEVPLTSAFAANQPTLGMDYNMRLKYVGINAYGAPIFMDPLSRYLIKAS